MQRVIRSGAKKVGVHQQTLCTLCKCHTAGRAEQRWHDGVSVLANVILQRHFLIRRNTLWLAFPVYLPVAVNCYKKKLQLMKLCPSGQSTILCTTAVCNLARSHVAGSMQFWKQLVSQPRDILTLEAHVVSACLQLCMDIHLHAHTHRYTHSLKVTRLYEQCKGITTEGNKKIYLFLRWCCCCCCAFRRSP